MNQIDIGLLSPYEKIGNIISSSCNGDNTKLKALDIGCGYGRHTGLLVELGFKVTAIDINQNCLNHAKDWIEEKHIDKKVDFLTSGLEEMSCDVIFDVIVAWHFAYAYNQTQEDCITKMKKIHQLLSNNGKLFISFRTRNNSIFQKDAKEISKNVYNNEKYNIQGYVFFDFTEIIDVVSSCGFKVDWMALEENNYCQGYTNGGHYWKNNWRSTQLDFVNSWWDMVISKK